MWPPDTSSNDEQRKETLWSRGEGKGMLRGPANNTASQKLWRVYISETLYPEGRLKPKVQYSDRDYEIGWQNFF